MKRTPHLISAFCLIPLLAGSGSAGAAEAARAWFADAGYVPPTRNLIIACHGYGCSRRTAVPTEAPWLVRAGILLNAAHGSASAERRALGAVVRLYTAYLAAQFGGVPDVPRSPPSMAGRNGQMDCIDEAANTTSLLLVLQDHGLLAWHSVERPQTRGLFIDGRYPHTTAVIVEKAGNAWAIDPWAKAPGQQPDILPLERWRQAS